MAWGRPEKNTREHGSKAITYMQTHTHINARATHTQFSLNWATVILLRVVVKIDDRELNFMHFSHATENKTVYLYWISNRFRCTAERSSINNVPSVCAFQFDVIFQINIKSTCIQFKNVNEMQGVCACLSLCVRVFFDANNNERFVFNYKICCGCCFFQRPIWIYRLERLTN